MWTSFDPDAEPTAGASGRPLADAPSMRIDYTAFPHIVEQIMAFSSWPVLSVFRCTCRALLARADKLQGAHILAGSVNEPDAKPRSPFGCVPALGARDYHQWSSKRRRDQWGLERARAQLAHTRVLEIIGFGDMLLTRITPHFRQVQVLRIRPDYDGAQQYKTAIRAHTLVVFGGRGPVPDCWRTCVGHGVQRLAITPRRSGYQEKEECLPIVVEKMSRGVKDVVLHLTGYLMDGAVRAMLAGDIATMLARTRRAEFQVTVVGAENIRCKGRLDWADREGCPREPVLESLSAALEPESAKLEDIDLQEPPGISAFREAIYHALVRNLLEPPEAGDSGEDESREADGEDLHDQPWPFSSASDALSRVTFLSLGEYAATIPRDELVLEVVEGIRGRGTELPLQEVRVVQRGG